MSIVFILKLRNACGEDNCIEKEFEEESQLIKKRENSLNISQDTEDNWDDIAFDEYFLKIIS